VSKPKGIRRKEDLDIGGLKIWRRICWKWG